MAHSLTWWLQHWCSECNYMETLCTILLCCFSHWHSKHWILFITNEGQAVVERMLILNITDAQTALLVSWESVQLPTTFSPFFLMLWFGDMQYMLFFFSKMIFPVSSVQNQPRGPDRPRIFCCSSVITPVPMPAFTGNTQAQSTVYCARSNLDWMLQLIILMKRLLSEK